MRQPEELIVYGPDFRENIRQEVLAPLRTALQSGNVENAKLQSEIPKVDFAIFYETEDLRSQTENPDAWDILEQKAEDEVSDFDPQTIQFLIQKYSPFIYEQPASHSRGHTAGDIKCLAHMMGVLSAEDAEKISNASFLAAVLAGVLHDGALGFWPRYKDPLNASDHGAAGAFALDVFASDLVPPHILKMARFNIAGHSNYANDNTIEKNGKTVVRRKFNQGNEDNPEKHTKISGVLARNADQGSINNVGGVVRDTLAAMEEGYDYMDGQFKAMIPTVQFERINDSNKRTIVTSAYQLSRSSFTLNRHTIFNPRSLQSGYIHPGAHDQLQFAQIVTGDQVYDQSFNAEHEIARFARLCRVLEPGYDINEKLETFDILMSQLPAEDRRYWAAGYHFITHAAYPRMHQRAAHYSQTTPAWMSKKSPVVQEVHSWLQHKSHHILEATDERLLNLEEYPEHKLPDMMEALLKE